MFSRLQAVIPLLSDEVHVERWVKKVFPWKTNGKSSAHALQDNRECYRLDMKNLPHLDATLVSESGAIIDITILNLSAGGLASRVSTPVPLNIGQVLTLVFVLPLEEPTLIKTKACLIEIKPIESSDSIVLHMEFSNTLDSGQKDLIHGFIVNKQFEMIQRLKGWSMS